MNEIQVKEALSLHAEIMANMAQAAGAMVNVCKDLKIMRDKKLYTELGFNNFEEYAENMVGIKQRQAYTYIKVYEELSPKLLNEQAGAGVTKLALLCQVSALDREEFIAKNDMQQMSVEDIKKLIAEKNGINEQLSMVTAEKSDTERELENKKSELKAAKDELEKIKMQTPLEATVITADVEKIKADLELETIQKIDAAIKEEQKAAKEKLKEVTDKFKESTQREADKLAAEQIKKIKEEAKQQVEKAEAEANAKAEVLAKRLSLESNSDNVEFMVHFANLQNCAESMQIIITKMQMVDKKEDADKLIKALKGALSAIADNIK